jgi:hypothetical protein
VSEQVSFEFSTAQQHHYETRRTMVHPKIQNNLDEKIQREMKHHPLLVDLNHHSFDEPTLHASKEISVMISSVFVCATLVHTRYILLLPTLTETCGILRVDIFTHSLDDHLLWHQG